MNPDACFLCGYAQEDAEGGGTTASHSLHVLEEKAHHYVQVCSRCLYSRTRDVTAKIQADAVAADRERTEKALADALSFASPYVNPSEEDMAFKCGVVTARDKVRESRQS